MIQLSLSHPLSDDERTVANHFSYISFPLFQRKRGAENQASTLEFLLSRMYIKKRILSKNKNFDIPICSCNYPRFSVQSTLTAFVVSQNMPVV